MQEYIRGREEWVHAHSFYLSYCILLMYIHKPEWQTIDRIASFVSRIEGRMRVWLKKVLKLPLQRI